MFAVSSVTAARPVVGFSPTSDATERAPTDPRLPEDKVSLSPEAREELRQREAWTPAEARAAGDATAAKGAQDTRGGKQPGQVGTPRRLTEDQERQVVDLKQRDLHVRQHEAAHQAAGGDLTGAATFSYQTGPDGRSYAVGGEVPIAARSGRTPDETIAIARRVRSAALAPADPSPADLAAAASAIQMEQRAQQQKRAQQTREAQGGGQPAAPSTSLRSGPQAGTLERVIMQEPVRAPDPSTVT